MNDKDFKKIGDEMVKVLEPVYEQLDRMEKKQDAHTAEIIQLQAESGAIKDKVTSIDEKLTNHIDQEREGVDEIRGHIGLQPVIRNNS